MIYDVSHRTTYRYSVPVSFSHHMLHLTPRPCDHQICHRTALTITPTPTSHVSAVDYFENPVTYITLQEQHRQLLLYTRSVIEVLPSIPPNPHATPPWDRIYAQLSTEFSEDGLDALQYCFETAKTQFSPEIEAYARQSFPPGRGLLAGALDLTQRIFTDFTFDPTATTVATPVAEVFAKRRGVCQDFAHLEIACLRALQLPARYVSGYLLTRPPDGQERLVGADASHAWFSLFCPGHGWVDLDPTNNIIVSVEHITNAWGRDYSDVSPVSGAIFGGGAHTVKVAVDVMPLEEPG